MLLCSAADFVLFEQHIRACVGCESNVCSIMKSRPYKLFRLSALAFLEGRGPPTTMRVFFFVTNFALHMAATGEGQLEVDVEWLDPMIEEGA